MNEILWFLVLVFSIPALVLAFRDARTIRELRARLEQNTAAEAAEACGATFTPRLRVLVSHPPFEGRTRTDLVRCTLPELGALARCIGDARGLPELVILDASHELVIEVELGELDARTIAIARPRAPSSRSVSTLTAGELVRELMDRGRRADVAMRRAGGLGVVLDEEVRAKRAANAELAADLLTDWFEQDLGGDGSEMSRSTDS